MTNIEFDPAVAAAVAQLAPASEYCTARERDYVVELRSAFEQTELEGASALPDWVTGEQLMVWGEAAVLWRRRARIVQAVLDAVLDAAVA